MWQPLINSMKGSRAWNSFLITPKNDILDYSMLIFCQIIQSLLLEGHRIKVFVQFKHDNFSKSVEASWFYCFRNYHDQQITFNKNAVKKKYIFYSVFNFCSISTLLGLEEILEYQKVQKAIKQNPQPQNQRSFFAILMLFNPASFCFTQTNVFAPLSYVKNTFVSIAGDTHTSACPNM